MGSNVASCVCLQVQQPAVSLSEQSLCGASTSITTMTPTITVWLVSSNGATTMMLIKDSKYSKYPVTLTLKAF